MSDQEHDGCGSEDPVGGDSWCTFWQQIRRRTEPVSPLILRKNLELRLLGTLFVFSFRCVVIRRGWPRLFSLRLLRRGIIARLDGL